MNLHLMSLEELRKMAFTYKKHAVMFKDSTYSTLARNCMKEIVKRKLEVIQP